MGLGVQVVGVAAEDRLEVGQLVEVVELVLQEGEVVGGVDRVVGEGGVDQRRGVDLVDADGGEVAERQLLAGGGAQDQRHAEGGAVEGEVGGLHVGRRQEPPVGRQQVAQLGVGDRAREVGVVGL